MTSFTITRNEVPELLEMTGFEIAGEFGSYDFRPLKETDPLVVIEAIKK